MSFSHNDWFDPNNEMVKKIRRGLPYFYNIHDETPDEDAPVGEAGLGDGSSESSSGSISEDSSNTTIIPTDSNYQTKSRLLSDKLHHRLKDHYELMNGHEPMDNHLENSNQDEYDSHVESLPKYTEPADSSTHLKHVAALGNYTSSSVDINKSLVHRHNLMKSQGNSNSKISGQININNAHSSKEDIHKLSALDHMTRNHMKSPEEMTLYTGTHINPQEVATQSKKSHIHFPAYTSTTTDYGTAKNFAKIKSGTDKDHQGKVSHIIRIKYPKQSNGAYIAHHSYHSSEREFLLPRGMTLKIHKNPTKMIDNKGAEIHIHDAEPVSGHK